MSQKWLYVTGGRDGLIVLIVRKLYSGEWFRGQIDLTFDTTPVAVTLPPHKSTFQIKNILTFNKFSIIFTRPPKFQE